jgi:hypothetical protein
VEIGEQHAMGDVLLCWEDLEVTPNRDVGARNIVERILYAY